MTRLAALPATALVLVLALAAIGAAGCGGSTAKPVDPNGAEVSPAGDIPDNQAFVTYSRAGTGFSVKVPEGWARTTTATTTTFTDKLNAVAISRPQTTQAGAPTAAAARPGIAQLAQTVPGFAAAKASVVTRTSGPALRITYLADGAPDAVTGKTRRNAVERYEFFHAGRRAVLTLSGPKGADNVDPWRIVTDSFRWMR
jgi:hypothetical protein